MNNLRRIHARLDPAERDLLRRLRFAPVFTWLARRDEPLLEYQFYAAEIIGDCVRKLDERGKQ